MTFMKASARHGYEWLPNGSYISTLERLGQKIPELFEEPHRGHLVKLEIFHEEKDFGGFTWRWDLKPADDRHAFTVHIFKE